MFILLMVEKEGGSWETDEADILFFWCRKPVKPIPMFTKEKQYRIVLVCTHINYDFTALGKPLQN